MGEENTDSLYLCSAYMYFIFRKEKIHLYSAGFSRNYINRSKGMILHAKNMLKSKIKYRPC